MAHRHTQRTKPNAELFLQCGQEGEYNIQVVMQPPQSPDFNWNDLSFFRSLQSDVHIQTLRTRAEIVSAVRSAFERYEPESASRLAASPF